MSPLTLSLNAWSEAWSSVIVSTVIQSTLLAVIVALVAWLLRGSAPAVRYWLWQIVAIRLLIVPFWTVSFAVPWMTSEAPVAVSMPENSLSENETNFPGELPTSEVEPTTVDRGGWNLARLTWQTWLMVAWAAIVAWQLLRLVVQRRRLSRLLAATTAAPDDLVAACREIAGRLGLARVPDVRVSPCDTSPFVCGILRPALVVPRSLLALKLANLAPVLAHELAHVKRRDLLWGWTAELARILYFFHPVAYWAGFHIRLERELACDQLALATSGRGAADYAATLVQVLSAASQGNIFRATVAAGLDGGKKRET